MRRELIIIFGLLTALACAGGGARTRDGGATDPGVDAAPATEDTRGDLARDVATDSPQDQAQDQAEDLRGDTPGDSSQDLPEDGLEDTPGDAPVDSPDGPPEDAIEDQAEGTPEDTIEDQAEGTAEDTIKDQAEGTPEDTIKDQAEGTPEDAPGDVPEDSPEPPDEDVPADAIGDTAADLTSDAPAELLPELPHDATDDAPADLPGDVPADVTPPCTDDQGCPDDGPCLQGFCDPDLGCALLPREGGCDDGDACTVDDACVFGQCWGAQADCDDGEACTEDTCAPATGCAHAPVTGACDDKEACTKDDQCLESLCAGVAYACDDGLACTADACDGVGGCVASLAEGWCLIEGSCVPEGAQQAPESCLACAPVIDGHAWTPRSDGAGCDDGDACTEEDLCQSGACSPGAARACEDGLWCTLDHCLPDTGCVFEPLQGFSCCEQDDDCGDGDACTEDRCEEGSCAHAPLGGPACCAPDCWLRECGPDSCGGSCGGCEAGAFCHTTGLCEEACLPLCWSPEHGVLACGDDGCGTSCGSCPQGQICGPDGQCATCAPSCEGKDCGPDGCGGVCGGCPLGSACDDGGACAPMVCPSCPFPDCARVGFEDEGLTGWRPSGDARAIHNLGSDTAPEGWRMAALTTLTGGAGAEASLEAALCVPAEIGLVTFRYRVYSEAFVEACGAPNPDRLEVWLETGQGGRALLERSISDLCPPGCEGCGGDGAQLEPADVGFDQGEVQRSAWRLERAWIGDLVQGDTPVGIRFSVRDGGDAQAHTALLVDDLRFEATPACDGDDVSTCDAGLPCVTATCAEGRCAYTTTPGCCAIGLDCGDDDPCTTDRCVDAACVHEDHCCALDDDCDDGDACTADRCGADARCAHDPIPDCCTTDEECADDDPVCTDDRCLEHACFSWSAAFECCSPTLAEEGFADGAPSTLSITNAQEGVGWTVIDGGVEAQVEDGALYYGDPASGSYASGDQRNHGVATFSFPTLGYHYPLQLSFEVYLDVEEGGDFDRLWLEAQTSAGNIEVWSRAQVPDMKTWESFTIDLSAFATLPVLLAFRFDTMDGTSNDTAGAFIDDLRLTSPCAPRACVIDDACDDLQHETLDRCVAGACRYGL